VSLSKYLNPVIKVVIFAGLGYVLYKQVFTNTSVENALQTLMDNLIGRQPLFILVLILTFINWSIETAKWRSLVNRLDQIGFWNAFKGILFGIAFSLFTPNRLGEYGGRVLVLKHHRIAAIVSTLVGSYSQIVVNMILGGLAFTLYSAFFLKLSAYLVVGISIFFLIGCAFALISFFNIDMVSLLFKRYSIFKKIAPYVDVVKEYTRQDLKRLLLYSTLRYGTYCLQFYLLLKVFKAGIAWIDAVVLIPTVFFVQAVLPSMAILDVSLRGEVAMQIIGDRAVGGLINVVAASVVLWFVNLIVPACIGGLSALTFRFFPKEGKD